LQVEEAVDNLLVAVVAQGALERLRVLLVAVRLLKQSCY
jgi:hypothetical protein